jgi:hypothetical protein
LAPGLGARREKAAKAKGEEEATKPSRQAAVVIPRKRRWHEDARHCLERATNTEIIKCAEEYL